MMLPCASIVEISAVWLLTRFIEIIFFWSETFYPTLTGQIPSAHYDDEEGSAMIASSSNTLHMCIL